MASPTSSGTTAHRPATTRALFDDVIVPLAGELGAVADRVAAYGRKSPGTAIGAGVLIGAALGWLAARPRQPPETWVQAKTRRLTEAAKSLGYPLNTKQLAALARTTRRDWFPR